MIVYGRWIIIGLLSVISLWGSPERGWVSSTSTDPSNTFKIVYNPTIYPIGEHKECPAEGVKVEFDGLFTTPKKDMIALVMNGDFYFSHETSKEFYFHLSSATAKIFIDDKEIMPLPTDKTVVTQMSIPYRFSQGRHRVKIIVYTDERQHIVGIRIGMSDPQRPILSEDDVAQKIQALTKKGTMLFNYLYAWQSQTLTLKNADKKSILFLSASRPATYTVNNVKNGKLKAIVYSGEGVEFHCDEATTILRVQNIPSAGILYPDSTQCHSVLGGLLCPEDQSKFSLVEKWIQKIAHKPLDGFSSVVDSKLPVIIPAIIVDKAMYQKIDQAKKDIQAKRAWLQQAAINPYPRFDTQRWSKILCIDETTVPVNRFRAYYMDKNDPMTIRHSEVVDQLTLLYSGKPFHTILADNFLGLWVGDFTFDKETTLPLNLWLSWAKISIIDNGEILYEGGQSSRFNHTFSQGNHRIEVEYINNYGHVDVNFDMIVHPVTPLDEAALRSIITPQTKAYLFSTYESEQAYREVELFMNDSPVPTVLFLGSYQTINYTIHNAKKGKLTAVIYNASHPIGKITTDGEVAIWYDNHLPYIQRFAPYENPYSTIMINQVSFKKMVGYVKNLTGITPHGFSSTQRASLSKKGVEWLDKNSVIPIPQVILDDALYQKIDHPLNTREHP